MRSSLAIGDFSRATHLSVKMLRHYHRVGLLEPADVDPETGYRRYRTEQIPTAQVIRRFRDLDMPLDEIRAVLGAPDLKARNDLIAAHLTRLESGLARTTQAVASLRDLLEHPGTGPPVERRRYDATPAAAVSATVDLASSGAWWQGALGEIAATLDAQGARPAGPPGGVYATELFTDERGRATVFVPCADAVRPVGRVVAQVVEAAELAVIVHAGPDHDIDRSYGTLAAYVADHALGVDGPIRETYLVGRLDTPDASRWRTEIGWPIFQTGPASEGPP
jgi:DNA-binding transcriptional MerR regulator